MCERLTAEREAEIRYALQCGRFELRSGGLAAVDALLAELDAVRAERDEARARHTFASSSHDVLELTRDALARVVKGETAATARAERAEAQAAEERERGHEALRKGLAAAQEKHDAMRAAEAGLAALREAVLTLRDDASPKDPQWKKKPFALSAEEVAAWTRINVALADTAAAAEAYTRRVRAEALREAAEPSHVTAVWLVIEREPWVAPRIVAIHASKAGAWRDAYRRRYEYAVEMREHALRGIYPWPRPAVIVERRDLLP